MDKSEEKYVRLRLRDIDNGAAHASDEHHAPRRLPRHEVARHGRREQVGAVDVDGPEPPHAVRRVVGGCEVLGEAGRRDEVVDLAVLRGDVVHARLDAVLVRHVGVVRCDFGKSLSRRGIVSVTRG